MSSQLAYKLGTPSGIVLEVKEEVGLGVTADAILIEGVLKVNDSIVMLKRDGAHLVRIRALLMPKPLDEMRDPMDKFTHVNEVYAAAGVKIVSPEIDGVLAGSRFIGLEDMSKFEEVKAQIEGEVKELTFLKDELGVIVKADALGSLEAIVNFLKRKGVPIRLADIGPVSKRDVVEAITVAEKDPLLGVILYFHVKVYPDAEELIIAKNIKTFSDPVIFNMIDGYLKWVESERLKREAMEFGSLILPCKIQVLKGYVFRRSNPAIFGVEVLEGRLKRFPLMKADGEVVGTVSGIQDKGKNLEIAYKGQQVAISIKEAFVGRTFDEGDILYSSPNVNDIKLLKTKYLDKLSEEERQLMDEIIRIKRSRDPSFIFV